MVQTFASDSNNDIYIAENGNLAILSGAEAVAAACATATKAQLGEMVLQSTRGLPNFQAIWVGSPNYQVYQTYLRNTILSVPGVLDVQSLSLSVSGNVLRYTATIVTQFGIVEIANG